MTLRKGKAISRRDFLARSADAGLGAFAVSSLFAVASHGESRAQPNIVLITADDLGMQLGCYGHKAIPTPNFDKLAEEGVRFEYAFITHSSCSPSRSSILTGLYPHQNGQIGLAHRDEYTMHHGNKTLPAYLKEAGYYNGVIGKVHVNPPKDFPWDYNSGPKYDGPGTKDVVAVAELAEGFLDQAKGKPFFLYVNYFDPHAHYKIPRIKGVPKKLVGPDDVEPFPFLAIDHPKIHADLVGYYNAVLRLDAGIGMLMDLLDKSGQADNTIMIFVSDNGPPFARAKMTCYEAGLQVPFLVRWPGKAKKGLVCDEFISTIDIVPTLLEAAGVKTPDKLPGKSLVPMLRGDDIVWREYLFCEFTSHDTFNYFPARTIRDRRYKLIHNIAAGKTEINRGKGKGPSWKASQGAKLDAKVRKTYELYYDPPEFELHDLQNDPHEFVNLAGKAEYAEVKKKLLAKLMQWRKQTNDPLLDEALMAKQITEHEKLRKAGRLRSYKEAGE